MLDSALVRKEFLENFHEFEYFHDIDGDFPQDPTYKCVMLIQDEKHTKHAPKFTKTCAEILKNFRHTTVFQAFFSIMDGPKFMAPHKNEEADESLRYVLGVHISPHDDGVLRYRGADRLFVQDEWFIFDTCQLHSVRKTQDYQRVVLMIDFLPYDDATRSMKRKSSTRSW